MPMIPSPTAALVYAAVKLSGYAVFAHGLNKIAGRSVPPIKFAVVKTGLGLVAGITYVFAVAPALGIPERSDAELFLGAAPMRIAVWFLVLARIIHERRDEAHALVERARWSAFDAF